MTIYLKSNTFVEINLVFDFSCSPVIAQKKRDEKYTFISLPVNNVRLSIVLKLFHSAIWRNITYSIFSYREPIQDFPSEIHMLTPK